MRMQIRMCPRIGSGVVEPWDASSGQDPALFKGEKIRSHEDRVQHSKEAFLFNETHVPMYQCYESVRSRTQECKWYASKTI
jgi:hypothetical protein